MAFEIKIADFCNRKKLKQREEQIFELTYNLSVAKSDMQDLQEENERLKKQIKGDRVCDNYCGRCKHGLSASHFGIAIYKCLLDCKCKDFERREESNGDIDD